MAAAPRRRWVWEVGCGGRVTWAVRPRDVGGELWRPRDVVWELNIALCRTRAGGPTSNIGSSVGLGGGTGLEKSTGGRGKCDVRRLHLTQTTFLSTLG